VVTVGDNHKPDTAIPLYRSLAPNCTGHKDCGRDIALAPFDPFRLSAAYGERAAQLFATHGVGGAKENTPFFLYIAFAHTHTPLAYTPAFNNASARPGRLQVFGNTLAEADHTIGVIVDALEAAKLGEKTLIFIASDNGPADLSSVACEVKGSPGHFTGAWMKSPSGGGGGGTCKGTVWEGGHRTVGIARWRGSVAPRVSHALAMTVDFMTTFVALAGGSLRTDRVYDGIDLSAVLGIDGAPGDDSKGHTALFHPHGSFETTTSRTDMVPAMRVGKWKAHWVTFGEERYVYKSCRATHRYWLYHWRPPLLLPHPPCSILPPPLL
jgi:arylsulfatase A-like enzyme